MLNNISQNWKELFNNEILEPLLPLCDKFYLKNRTFRCFEFFEPSETKFIILGQDPYEEGADGLSFSCNEKRRSISNIFNCLLKLKIINSVPKNGRLDYWAQNGVLLLNTMLTLGEKDWKKFTYDLLEKLMSRENPPYIFAWGSHAKKMIEKLPNQNFILQGTHPTANNEGGWYFEGFQLSPIFAFPEERLKIYTDGSFVSKQNKAGFAIYVPSLKYEASAKLKNGNYQIMPNGQITTYGEKKLTNIRAEALAIILAVKYFGGRKLEIITDSEFWIKCITEYMPNWTEKKA